MFVALALSSSTIGLIAGFIARSKRRASWKFEVAGSRLPRLEVTWATAGFSACSLYSAT